MRQNPEGYALACEALAKATAADARLISAPTLLVTGDADAVNPPGIARDLADRIAGARLSLVDRGGHWLTIERPEGTQSKDCRIPQTGRTMSTTKRGS